MSDIDVDKYKQRNEKKNRQKKTPVDWTGINDPKPVSKRPGYTKYIQKEDKIPGGLADNADPRDFNPKDLEAGILVEMEHTSDKDIATEIAMDHLTEDKNYYKKLKTIEKEDLRVDEEADGKKELDYGKEELDKTPTGLPGEFKPQYAEEPSELDRQRSIKRVDSAVNSAMNQKPASANTVDTEAAAADTVKIAKDDAEQAANSQYIAQQEYDEKVRNRWKKLKKAMADDAFMDINEALESDEPEEEQEQEAAPEGDLQSDGQDPETGEELDDDELHEMLSGIDSGEEEVEEDGEDNPPSDESDEESEDQDGDGTADADEESLEELMDQLGYSQEEIAHTVQGHHFPDVDELQQAKAQTEHAKREGELSLQQLEAEIKQMEGSLKNGHAEKINQYEADHKKSLLELEREHARRMKDLEYAKAQMDAEANDETEHKKSLRQIELERAQKDIPGDKFDDTEHQKRMMDLEYEKAKREMELDLEIKKQQADLKMKQMMIDADVRKKEKAQSVKDKATESKAKDK